MIFCLGKYMIKVIHMKPFLYLLPKIKSQALVIKKTILPEKSVKHVDHVDPATMVIVNKSPQK